MTHHLLHIILRNAIVPLLFLEFIGTTELLVIAFVALIIFGPRKLPELGRSLGKSIGEFKRASEDFKRTWEREVEVERVERDLRIDGGTTHAITDAPSDGGYGAMPSAGEYVETNPYTPAEAIPADTELSTERSIDGQPIARASFDAEEETPAETVTAAAADRSRKKDWL
ncbi:MAG: twin-arginine translocase TatA/TatE family subunit [Pyrinomonadaceae bacterium]|nr:twin-arginine translocase TatA/TatE family subunit [Pyrinomonadaceae bacterium]